MPVDYPDFRERLLTYLAFLSSKECLELVGDRERTERLAYELCRIWFDSVYVPSRRYIEAIKGDYSTDLARAFESCFDNSERALLERFHRFFELRLDMLPHIYRAERRFPDVDLWRNIVRDAAYLLDDLDPDGQRRRARFRDHLQAVAEGHASASSLRELFAAEGNIRR